jgi:hypothetical protein
MLSAHILLMSLPDFAPHESAGPASGAGDVQRTPGRLKEFPAETGRPYDSIARSRYSPLLTPAAGEDKLAEKKRQATIPGAELHTGADAESAVDAKDGRLARRYCSSHLSTAACRSSPTPCPSRRQTGP